MSDPQKLGKRVFEQRCSVCHTQATITSKIYGPALYKEIVDGNEDAIRERINTGVKDRMPGFRYGLQSSEIEGIIEYLKTLPKPKPQGSASESPVD
jgi:mono/diheme cytochrome c family protein